MEKPAMIFKTGTVLGLVAAIGLGGMALAASHGGDTDPAVKARQAHMDLYSFNLGILGKMAKGEMEFDAAASQAAADNLVTLSQINQASYWVPDTDNMSTNNTRLLPALFDNIDDARAKGQALVEASTAMAAAAGTLEGVQASIGAVGGACGACHKAYRAPES
jgi:cytochrome c556